MTRVRYEDMPEGVEITATGLRYTTNKYTVLMDRWDVEVWAAYTSRNYGGQRTALLRSTIEDPLERSAHFADMCRCALLDALPGVAR